MSASPARAIVLDLYRSILRLGRTWAGPNEEKEYIVSEARRQFRDRRSCTAEEVDGLIRYGQERLYLAQHYGIPYPRLHHQQQLVDHLYSPEAPRSQPLRSKNAEVNAKLQAAAKRLKLKKDL